MRSQNQKLVVRIECNDNKDNIQQLRVTSYGPWLVEGQVSGFKSYIPLINELSYYLADSVNYTCYQ